MRADQPRPGGGWVVDELSIDAPAAPPAWRVLVQRPARHQPGALPWLWLLHGSTASADDLRPLLLAAAQAMDAGDVPPMIIAAPDAPDGYRSSWWVDSAYAPPAEPPRVGEFVAQAGRALETAVLGEVRPAVEAGYEGSAGPARRMIGGISMGGATALRWLLVRPDLFAAAVLLSPAVYGHTPPDESSARGSGAFGVGSTVYEPARFRQVMHYPTLLAQRAETSRPARVVIFVGDGEPAQVGDGRRCDLDLGAAELHAALKPRPDLISTLRVVGGGHDWPLWEQGIVTALRVLAGREG